MNEKLKQAKDAENRKKVYEKLYEWEKENNPFFPSAMKYDREDLVAFAEKYASLMGEWIPVSERLPESGDDYIPILAFIEMADQMGNSTTEQKTIYFKSPNKFLDYRYNKHGEFETYNYDRPNFAKVTHWMPLPKLPTPPNKV